MMKIEFSTDGAAFYDEYADDAMNDTIRDEEIVRVLKIIMDAIVTYGANRGPIMDINGNKIGEWSL